MAESIPKRPDDLDRLAMDVVAVFAIAQGSIADALEAYLDEHLAKPVKDRVWSRVSRMSDDELCSAATALAMAVPQLDLVPGPFTATYRSVKRIRDDVAHGGLLTTVWFPVEAEFGLGQWDAARRSRAPVHITGSQLRAALEDARWLSSWTWKLQLHIEENGSTPFAVSDVPGSAFVEWARSLDDWPMDRPVCREGHLRVEPAVTTFGRAWWCADCGRAELVVREIA